jgi:NAD(P)-dependent dehydrogenase (short-subunit alcohol dehydrogenase family)
MPQGRWWRGAVFRGTNSLGCVGELRTAIVTGASSGIGRAIACAFGAERWKVAVGARRRDRLEETAAEIEARGGEPFAHHLDVTDARSIDEFFGAAERALGPVDILVNNAGTSTPGPLHRIPDDALRCEVDTNLLGPMLATRRAIDSMLGRGAVGDLVFISSDATRHARPRMAAYTATKAGLELLARSLAMELEGTGIRSTIVRVGPTFSEFGFAWPADELAELMEYWPRFGLQRHPGTLDPEDVARAVLTAVTAPPGVHFDTIEVQPEAPGDSP